MHALCVTYTSTTLQNCRNGSSSPYLRPTITCLKYLAAASPSPPPSNTSFRATSWRCFATPPPSWNPQNTDQPLVLPSPQFSAEECVCAQLDALQKSNEPWQGHGIQLCYEFGLDIGGMDPSMYFGFPKDLYHLG
jgi:hypothetical protein